MTSAEEQQFIDSVPKVIYFALGQADGWRQSLPSGKRDRIAPDVLEQADPDEYFRDGLFTKAHQIGPFHLLEMRFAPNFVIPRHHHNYDQMVLVLEGSARQGRRWFHAGDGYFTKAFTPYSTAAGPEGCRVVEVRKDPIDSLDIWWDEDKPERWERGRWDNA